MNAENRDESIAKLEEIKTIYLDKVDNDPLVRRVINVVINEFKARTI